MSGCLPRMWKRDFKSAFRSCPLDQCQAWCSWSAWKVGKEVWMSRHLASPFGWVSSCFSFHRLGEFIAAVLIRFLRVPTGRYVDDFFGVGRSNVHWSGGKCMDSMMALLGFEVDHKKSVDDAVEMVVLGHLLHLRDSNQSVALRDGKSKAVRWGHTLSWILHTGLCPPTMASLLVVSAGQPRVRPTKLAGPTSNRGTCSSMIQLMATGSMSILVKVVAGGWSS